MPAVKPSNPNPNPQSTPAKDPSRISGMFDAIAERYDFLNHLLSAGLDKRWRRQAVDVLQLTGRETVLDLVTGTADLALAATSGERRAKRVVGIDFSAAMLQIGKDKVRGAGPVGPAPAITLIRGDATRIPLRDAAVDATTIGFGIRNVEAPGSGVPRNSEGSSSGRHACDSGIFTAALVGSAQFLPVVFPTYSAAHRTRHIEASERLHVLACIRGGVPIARRICATACRTQGLAPCVQCL